MNPEKAIKKQARTILSKNNWPAGVGVILTLGVTLMILVYLADLIVIGIDHLLTTLNVTIFETFSILPLLIMITLILAGFCFLLPLFMGSVRFMYQMSKTGESDFSQVFYYMGNKRYTKSLKIYIGLIVRSLWQMAISFIPAIIIYLYATAVSATDSTTALSILLYFTAYALLVGGVLLFNALTVKYFLALYYFFENDNLSVSEICRLSEKYMEKFGSTTVKLNFSLLPVSLANLLIIPAIFVLPYVMTSKATSAKWIIELSKQTENKDE